MKITCIIATKNSAATLRRAINSVLLQSFPLREVIVQDGGSTDGTKEILKEYGDRIAWTSEADSGVYDAWNKALSKAKGEWGLFLGADDHLLQDETLARCWVYLKRLSESIDFAYGDLLIGTKGEVEIRLRRTLEMVYALFISNMGLPFPATFVRMRRLQETGFDASFKIAGDFDFAARCLAMDNVARLPVTVSYMERGGISDSPRHAAALYEERRRVIRKQILPKADMIAKACLRYLGKDD